MDKQEVKNENLFINIFLFILSAILLVSILLCAGISCGKINFIVILFAVIFPKNIKFI